MVEEVAYTWFNRLLAIKILEVNGYIPEQLAYTEGSRTPLIVQNAKRGDHNITNKADQQLLLEFLKEDKDEGGDTVKVVLARLSENTDARIRIQEEKLTEVPAQKIHKASEKVLPGSSCCKFVPIANLI